MQIGLGYDIPLNTTISKTQLVLSLFLSYHHYFGQNPRNTETWNVNTLRAGFVLKLGQGHLIENPNDGEVTFLINPSTNLKSVKIVREVFPIRNLIFFNSNSNEIPSRYFLLDKNEVKNFKEKKVQFNTSKNISGRSERQMLIYYNILNILGDRMVKNPSTTITLVGSTETGREDGLIMAKNVTNYLVTTLEINENRIAVEGIEKPKNSSEIKNGVRELEALKEGNKRVTIVNDSPVLLIEFQSGKDASERPIEIVTGNETINGDVAFNVAGAKKSIKFLVTTDRR
ncbi:MAG: hypothetical protein ACI9XR_002507 [Flavobacterium sp.]|jgi:hypothetical protein